MNLSDLNPKWIMPHNWCGPDYYIGVSFLCPHCNADAPEHGPNRRRRLSFTFWPHIDPSGLREKYGPGWYPQTTERLTRVAGETFDTLTLAPSVNFDGHWGGIIQDGVLVP